MATRVEIVQVLNELIEWGEALTEQTNRRFREDTLDRPEALISFLAASVHRALRAIQLIEPHHLDDQMAPLARFIVEAALNIEYVAIPTTRNGKQLTPDAKVTMFNASLSKNVRRLHELSIFKKGDIAFDDSEREIIRAIKDDRKSIEVSSGMFWHGVQIPDICTELQQANEGNIDATTNIRAMQGAYGYLSQESHPGPNYGSTFVHMNIGDHPVITNICDCDVSLSLAVDLAVDVFVNWARSIYKELRHPEIGAKASVLKRRLYAKPGDDQT